MNLEINGNFNPKMIYYNDEKFEFYYRRSGKKFFRLKNKIKIKLNSTKFFEIPFLKKNEAKEIIEFKPILRKLFLTNKLKLYKKNNFLIFQIEQMKFLLSQNINVLLENDKVILINIKEEKKINLNFPKFENLSDLIELRIENKKLIPINFFKKIFEIKISGEAIPYSFALDKKFLIMRNDSQKIFEGNQILEKFNENLINQIKKTFEILLIFSEDEDEEIQNMIKKIRA